MKDFNLTYHLCAKTNHIYDFLILILDTQLEAICIFEQFSGIAGSDVAKVSNFQVFTLYLLVLIIKTQSKRIIYLNRIT